MAYEKQPLDAFTVWIRGEIRDGLPRAALASWRQKTGRPRQTPQSPPVPKDEDGALPQGLRPRLRP